MRTLERLVALPSFADSPLPLLSAPAVGMKDEYSDTYSLPLLTALAVRSAQHLLFLTICILFSYRRLAT